jgi:hypothetical protein
MKYTLILTLLFLLNDEMAYSQKASSAGLYTGYLAAKAACIPANKKPSGRKVMEATLNKMDIDHPALAKIAIDPIKYFDTYFDLRKLVKGEEPYINSDIERAAYLLYNVKNTALKKKYFNRVLQSKLGKEGITDSLKSLFEDAKLVLKDPAFLSDTKKLLDKYERLETGAASPGFSLKTDKGEVLTPVSFKGKVLVMQVLFTNVSADSLQAQKKRFDDVARLFAGADSVCFVRVNMEKTGSPGKIGAGIASDSHVQQLVPVNRNEFINQFMLMNLTRHMIINDQKMMYSHLPDGAALGVFVNVAKLTTQIDKDEE